MKMLKRTLSVFLAALMLFSCMSMSVVGFAAEVRNATSYRALAYSFFNYSIKNSGFTSQYVVNTDANGYPSRSIVGDLEQYTISNHSGEYEYADLDSNPIRAISYDHMVTAHDNSTGTIRNAAVSYLAIVDEIISYEYGIGLYTVPMVANEVAEALKFTKGDDGEYLFLDGYTYLVDAAGKIVARSPQKTYEVVDGEIKELDVSDRWLEAYNGTYYQMDLYEYCHVDTIIDYFSGNMTSVNSGNWFHDYTFVCKTDIDTILVTEALVNQVISCQELTVKWSMFRQYDDSGTVAQYYNAGYVLDKGKTTTDYTRMELTSLEGSLSNYFATYLGNAANGKPMLATLTNQNLLNVHYETITAYYDTFSKLSNEAAIAVFGQAAYSYINLVTQLTPIVNYASDAHNPKYWPKHTYSKYTDDYGNNVVYQVDADNLTSIVHTIDGLLKSDEVGSILKLFFDFTDPKYENMAYYHTAQNAKTAQDMLKIVIADFVYQDSIINMLLELVYPMVASLLDDLITDQFIEETLGGLVDGIDLGGLIDGVVNQGEGWQATIYAALASIGVTLTPAGLAYVWNKYGYLNDSYGYTTTFPQFRAMHDHLKAAKGGITSSGLHNTGDYYAIGSEHDGYSGDRWKDVDFSKMVWGINGDQTKFLKALDAVLAPLAPLLGVLFGDGDCSIAVANVLATKLTLILNDGDITHNYYNTILLPLFEMLGIPNLLSGSAFESRAQAITKDTDRNPNTISAFLNDGLLNPILGWVNNVLLADPIGTILNLLPNLSYYLTSGAVMSSLKNLQVPIKISHAIVFGAKITVYTLDVMDLIGEDTLAFLDSVQGIIDLIGFGVDTGIPVVGYHAQGDSMVYAPGMGGYNPDYHKIAVTEAYVSDSGLMNLYYSDLEFRTKISGVDADGNYTQYAIRNEVGYANAAGYVVTDHSTENPESVYNTPVKQYYQYSVVLDEETGETETIRVLYESMIPQDVFEAGEYDFVESIVTYEEDIALPPIMDYKLQACGTVTTVASGRYGEFVLSSSETWASGTRKYIDVQVGGMETEGLVLLFLFRYIFSAVMYRGYDVSKMDFSSDYTLLNAFGLDNEALTDELFAGLRIQDIIDNIALHPDAAIAALFELFYKNEWGSLYEVVNGIVQENPVGYSYDLEYVDYHTDEIMSYAERYNDFNYGTSVLYSEHWTKEQASYIVDNLDDIADNVFKMLKLDGMGSIGEFLGDLVGDLLFTNDMLSTIASALYGMISDLGGSIDIPGILDAALEVDITKNALLDALVYEFGDDIKKNKVIENEDGTTTTILSVYNKLLAEQAEAQNYESLALQAQQARDYETYEEYKALALEKGKYNDATFYKYGVDEEGNEIELFSYDWGYENEAIKAKYTDAEIFLRGVAAIASPFSILIKFLFAGEDLSILDLVNIPGYETYYYAWIPLMETLGATDGLLDFKQYYTKLFAGESTTAMNCDAIYYTLKPLLAFVDKVIANPVEVVLNLIPSLLFFISIGGLNDVLNNLIHFAYVLLDILSPIVDAYPVINSLLSNLNIGGMTLNLSVPLDFDFNQLVNSLLEGLLGESLSFDIENTNLVLGTQEVEKEVFIPTIDEDGNEILDEEGNVVGTTELQMVTEEVYAVGTLNIKLPYIDFSTLCSGTVHEKTSISGNRYVTLNAAGGADLITLVFRIVTDTLFFEDNAENIANFLIGFCQLDDENGSDELLMEIFLYLNKEAQEAEIPDVIMNLIYTIYSLLVPIADELGSRFANVDFSITDLFEGMDDLDLTKDRISALLGGGETNPTLSGFARLIALLKEFFAKIGEFFSALFGG